MDPWMLRPSDDIDSDAEDSELSGSGFPDFSVYYRQMLSSPLHDPGDQDPPDLLRVLSPQRGIPVSQTLHRRDLNQGCVIQTPQQLLSFSPPFMPLVPPMCPFPPCSPCSPCSPCFPCSPCSPCSPCAPCSCTNLQWMSPTPAPMCGAPSPPSPPSWLLQPEPHPRWCACVQSIHHSHVAAQQVEVTPPSAATGRDPEQDAGGQGSRRETCDKSDFDFLDFLWPQEDKENTETDNNLFLETLESLDKLCSSEYFSTNVHLIMDPVYLDSILPVDPEPTDVLACEEDQQQVTSTPSTDHLDIPPAEVEAIERLSPAELKELAFDVVLEEFILQLSANIDSTSEPVAEGERVEESLVEASPVEASPVEASPVEESPFDASINLDPPSPDHQNTPEIDCFDSLLQLLANISPDNGLSSGLEATQHDDESVEEPAAVFCKEGEEEVSKTRPNTQTSKKLEESASIPSGVSGDPQPEAIKDPASDFMDMLKAEEPEEQISAQKSSHLQENANPKRSNSPGNSSDSVPDKLPDPPKVPQVPQESSGPTRGDVVGRTCKKDEEMEAKPKGTKGVRRSLRLLGRAEKHKERPKQPSEGNVGKTVEWRRGGTTEKQETREGEESEGQSSEKEKHQNLRGETQEHEVEEEEQREATDPGESGQSGAENAPSTERRAQEEEGADRGRVRGKEEAIRTFRRFTRSMKMEEKVQLSLLPVAATGSRKTETQGGVIVLGSLHVSGPLTRSRSKDVGRRRSVIDATSTGSRTNKDLGPISGPEPDTRPSKESQFLREVDKNTDLTPTLRSKTKQSCGAGAGEDTRTRFSYSLRSRTPKPKVQNQTGKEASRQASPDQAAGVKDNEYLSPITRKRLEQEETSENIKTTTSPSKRGKLRNDKEGRRKDEEAQEPSPRLTRSKNKTQHVSNSSARNATSCGDFPCRRRTRLSMELQTKCKDFILCRTNRRQAVVTGKGQTGRRKTLRR